MMKKLILPLIFIFGVVFLVSCGETSTTIEVTSSIDVTTKTETTESVSTELTSTEVITTEVVTTEMITTEMPTTVVPTTEAPTTEAPTIAKVELPDLEGYTVESLEGVLDASGVEYDIQYVTNKNQTEGLFIEYGDDLQPGDLVDADTVIHVYVYTHTIYLPDLTGMGQADILNYFFSVGITSFNFGVINDNTVDDGTFSSYEDFDIGDQIEDGTNIIVLIGFNDEKIPELDGLIKRQIIDLYADLDINYEFTYVIDDDYPEDLFAYYDNVSAGDFYDNESIVVNIVLYKNTFTDAETSLMISKYVDNETDSAIELYNPTDSAINLNDYHIVIYSGGSYEITYSIPLEDELLEPGDTYLITSTGTEPSLQRYANVRSADLLFDGVNDTIQLVYKNGTYIDTIYQIGDRGSDMDNEIFVRREGIVSGNRTFNLGEWTAFVPDYYEIVTERSHPIDIVDVLTYTEQEIAAFVVNTFDSPYGGMNLVSYEGAADGDTAYFYPGFMDGERVRFIGNDTPETSPAVVDEPEPWGLEAKAYTQTILEYADNNNKNIYVQSDPDIGYTEGYGRHLGLIWVDLGTDVLSIDIKDSSGNVLFTEELTGVICINYLLVKNGFSADEYASTSTLTINNRYMYRWFDEAERFAKENNLGVHEE